MIPMRIEFRRNSPPLWEVDAEALVGDGGDVTVTITTTVDEASGIDVGSEFEEPGDVVVAGFSAGPESALAQYLS